MVETSFEIVPGMPIGGGAPPIFIAGPCVIESEEQAFEVARQVRDVAVRASVPLIFKASFDKANRSSIDSFRGPGLIAGLAILGRVRSELQIPVLTDVHLPEQAAVAAEVVDVLQVPAFMCRQTDLLVACAETGKPVNVKKGQFLAARDMSNVVSKLRSAGGDRIMLTERGSSFGYHNLVVDVRGLPVMRCMAPVVFDCTHSLQLPGGLGHATGGAREFHLHLARAAAAVGIDAFFVEVHSDPDRALSDATTQLRVQEFERLVHQVQEISRVVGGFEE